ncbi:MAG: hypothetical protein WKG07_03135 [Hymenobacter sp.]
MLTIAGLPGPPLEVPAGRTVLAAIHAAGHDWSARLRGRGPLHHLPGAGAGRGRVSDPPTAPELRYRAAGRASAKRSAWPAKRGLGMNYELEIMNYKLGRRWGGRASAGGAVLCKSK